MKEKFDAVPGNNAQKSMQDKLAKALVANLAKIKQQQAAAKDGASIADLKKQEVQLQVDQQNKQHLDALIRDLYPKIKEANLIAKEVGRNLTFELR